MTEAAEPARRTRGPYRKSEERRREIVAAALEVFSTSGFRAGSLKDIGLRIGIDPSTILHHFGSKEGLLRAGLAHYIGTHWPVMDASAATFAGVFYQSVLRASIGSALVRARRAVRARRSPDWADYVHYGDGEFRLKTRS